MSKVIDEKIVEMKFDNKNFESNVATTMSTLDKFKQKLNLTGASKGLENIKTQSDKVNFSGMSNAIGTVQAKFSALEIMGTTALVNITNTAIEAGKRMVKALTIAPISDGFKEYELTMNTIQTIMNSTGKSADEVKKKLETLDEYADKTVYSTADMFNNIYKFTNAGIDLDTATRAMIGIANATADAGQGAQQASMAYYNLAQSLSTGYLTTIDYKSLNLANIVTKDLKQSLADTAVQMGTLKKVGDNLYSTGKKQYNLQQLFSEALSDQWATTDVMMKVFGDYANAETEVGKRAWDAATKVKTFSGMMESLKASAGTGWKKTWELILGDIEPATKMWTGLAKFIGNILDSISNWRNGILEGALGKSFKHIAEGIKNIISPVQKASESIKEVVKTAQDYTKVVDDIILGKYKNAPERFQLLAEAGYDWAHAQNLVNERLGCSFRYADNYKETQQQVTKTQEQLNESNNEFIKQLIKMSDAELKAKGYTDENIKSLRELESLANKLGMSIDDVLVHIDEMDGRWILLDSFNNFGKALTYLFDSFKTAWKDVFTGDASEGLFNIIAGFHKFSELLKNNVIENADALASTLRGVFSILGFITDIVSGGLKIGLTILKGILSVFNMNIFKLTAGIGDALYNTRKWVKENIPLSEALEAIGYIIGQTLKSLIRWIETNETIQKSIAKVTDRLNMMKDSFKKWAEGLKETDNIPKYILQGLANGIKNGTQFVLEAFTSLGKTIIEVFCKIFNINSPSKVFFAIGGFIIAGLIGGLLGSSTGLFDTFKSIGMKCIEIFNNIDWGKLLAIGVAAGLFVIMNQITKVIKNFTSALAAPLKGLGSMLTDFGNAAEKWAEGKKFESMTKGFKNIAMSLLILAGSLLLLSKMSWPEIGKSLVAMLGVMTLFGLLIFALSKMDLDKFGNSKMSFIKISMALLTLSAGMGLISHSIKKLGTMKLGEVVQGIAAMGAIVIGLVYLSKAIAKLNGNKGLKDVEKVGKLVRKLATSLFLIVLVIKMAAILKPMDFVKGTACMILFGAFSAAMILASKKGGKDADKAGKMIKKMSTSLLLIIAVMKLSGTLKENDIKNGIKVMTMTGILFAGIIAVSHFAGKNGAKAGLMLLGVTSAMMMMVGVIKLVGILKPEEIKKGITAMGFMSLFFMGLLAASKLAGKFAIQGGAMLLMAATAMLAITGIMFIIGKINPDELKRSLKIVSVISALFAGLMATSHLCTPEATKTIAKMTIAMGVLAASIAILSFIDESRLLGAAKSLGIVMVAFGVLISSTRHLTGSVKFFKQLLPMTLIIGLLSLIVGQLAKLQNPDGAVKAAQSLSLLMIAMSAALVVLNKAGTINKNTVKAILSLTAMAVPLAAFMAVLNGMKDTNNSIKNVISLSLLAGAMTLLLIPINSLGQIMSNGGIKAIGGVALGVLALTAMAVPLAAFMAVLNGMKDTNNAMANVKALSALCGAMTLLLIPLTILGAIFIGTGGVAIGATALGIVALTAMVIPMLAFIEALKKMSGIENATERMNLLMDFMTRMTDILMKVSLVAPLAIMADIAIGGFIGAMMAIGTLAIATGALMQKFPSLQSFLDTGIPVLVQISDGIGQIISAFVKGALVQLSSALPEVGMNLSLFMTNLTPFIVGMKTIDGKVLSGVAILSGTIIALTAAELVNGILSLFGVDLSHLGTRLTEFANNASGFFSTIQNLDANSIQGVKALAEAIKIITQAELLQGITSFFTGGNSIDKFSEQLPILGQGLQSFINSLGTMSDDQVKTAANAAEVIKTLATASRDIPNTGGLLGALVGNNDMGPWAQQLPIMAEGITKFVQTIQNGGIESKAIEIAKTASEVIKTLAGAAKEIPNAGGLLAGIVGDNDMSKFASQFPIVGKGIVEFTQAMVNGEITKDKVEVAKIAAEMIGILAKVAKDIPNTGGLLAALVGDNDLGKFAEKLPQVGKGLNNFAKELTGFTSDKVDCIQTAVSALYAITAISSLNLKDAGNSYGEFGNKLVEFGKKLNEFTTEISKTSLEDLQSADEKLLKLLEIVLRLNEVNIDGMKSFSENLKNIAKEGVKGFVEEFSGNDPKNKAKEGIQQMIQAGIDGAEEKKSNVRSKFKEVAGAAIEGLEDSSTKNKAYNVGKDFVQGFANGIRKNMSQATSAATELGKYALRAAKKAIDSNSPSKETYKLGIFFDQGFVNGIKSLSNKVYDASTDVGERAKDGLNKAVSRISDIINEDIDTQPTIRPVLDLSNVKSGIGTIGSLFGQPSLAVATNIGAISSGMNNRQNGNEDVVAAIDKLGKTLSGVRGDTYNVNGVTYDDGSAISDAVSELVRAARVERRR